MPFTDNRAGERRAFNRASAIGLWATHAGKRCKKARLPSTPASALQESAGQSARHYEAIRPIAILTPFSGMSCPGRLAAHSVFDVALLFWLVGTVGMGYKRDACGMHLG